MRVAVFGLGYVGAVTAAALAARGHTVVGVDSNAAKVEMVEQGIPPVSEPGLAELVRETTSTGNLRVTTDGLAAVRASELSLVCVGTPSDASGDLNDEALRRVLETIGEALAEGDERHTVVVRSTVVPGTCERLVIPLLEEASARKAGEGFGVAFNPEFLREGSSLADFAAPAKTVVGQLDAASGDAVEALYEGLDAPVFRVSLGVAEMAKFVDNAFHAVKIGFANEIGAVCHAFGLDSHEVMEIFKSDRKLNISTAYLTPGFAFGGSCLPKDLRALLYAARQKNTEVPLLRSILPSNEAHLQRTLDRVLALGRRRVGLFGLAFKPGTDDLRESPLVELAERLLGKGFDLKIYDAHVSVSRLLGSNRAYIEERIPHLAALLAERPEDVLEHAEICIVGAEFPEVIQALAAADERVVVDLVRLPDAEARRGHERYIGVAW